MAQPNGFCSVSAPAAYCLYAGPSGSMTPPALAMAAPSTPRSQPQPSTSAALPAALKNQHPATTSQVSSCPVSVSDPHTGEVQHCLLHTQSKQWQGVLLTSQAWSGRLSKTMTGCLALLVCTLPHHLVSIGWQQRLPSSPRHMIATNALMQRLPVDNCSMQ